MDKNVGVLLAGCGYLDGSEISESVLTMYHLDMLGARITCMAPRGAQRHAVDHASGSVIEGERRDVFEEAARIARGKLLDVANVRAEDLDALIIPGGFGVAKNLCDFAVRGSEATAHTAVAQLIRDMHSTGKPIGALCIAPALIAVVLGDEKPKLTIGDDATTAEALEAMGATHQRCVVTGFAVDDDNLIVSTPAYMYDARISEVGAGIEKLVATVLDRA